MLSVKTASGSNRARSRCIWPVGFNGFDPSCFAPGASRAGARASIAALAEFNRHTAKTHSGIYRDLAVRKRPTEIDPQIGVIAELGRASGVDTPAIRRLVELIHEIEDGRREMAFATFERLIETCVAARAGRDAAHARGPQDALE